MAATAGSTSSGPTHPLLAGVWQRSLPVLRDRVARLMAAAESSYLDGALREDTRREVCDIAHKLAGSLGMFGYPQSTAIARELEILLEQPEPVSVTRFSSLAQQLGRSLPL